MNSPCGKLTELTGVLWAQVFPDPQGSVWRGTGKAPSRVPSATEKTSTIIYSGGGLKELYPFQVNRSMREGSWSAELSETVMRSDGKTGGVDAIHSTGIVRITSMISGMNHTIL